MDKNERIEELVAILNKASEAYFIGNHPIMTDYEWDAMLDELTSLETETGYVLPNSPTQKVGYEETNGEKEQHEFSTLSLAKTKKISELQKWAEHKPIWLSWKLDGLTLVLTFDGGSLTKILTRGTGNIGTNITFMKNAIKGFPLKINYNGHMVVRGEATISYTDFDLINDTIEDDDEKYANPRNLASGTLGLDSSNVDIVKERRVHFNAFTLVYAEENIISWGARMDFLANLGFTVIDRELTTANELPEVIDRWTKKVESHEMDIPVDGLVICFDDTEYASTGSVTGHHATRAGIAYKWPDMPVDTELEYIEWSCAVSTITPIAVFKPIKIEGTKVKRASLSNISEMERLGIGKKSIISVIKSNKIIPKVIAVKKSEGEIDIPNECPVCHARAEIRKNPKSGTKTLHCVNPDCTAKHVKKFARFASKSGMDIDGLSTQTIVKFINKGFIAKNADIYHLQNYAEAIKKMDGFGDKSYKNLIKAIEKSRNVHPSNFIYSLCIPMIGLDAGKKIIGDIGFDEFLNRLRNGEDFKDIKGIGLEKANSIIEWYQNFENKDSFDMLLEEVKIKNVEFKTNSTNTEGKCSGLTFVITGDVHHYKNRDEFTAYVESQNGSVVGSVSKKTNYLVNNDIESPSSKNMKAKELGIPNITEDKFVEMFG